MVCEHLAPLEKWLLDSGVEVTFRGQAWSKNCREWVYFFIRLDTESLRSHFGLPNWVRVHEHNGCHSGAERGFYCARCQDAVMGLLDADSWNRTDALLYPNRWKFRRLSPEVRSQIGKLGKARRAYLGDAPPVQ